ncbi:MAG TPA: response regulator [Burkholderiales bacterium]|nr:response regulator [Burkholderiales bacterium]
MFVRQQLEVGNRVTACDVAVADAGARTDGSCMRILVVVDDPMIAFPLAWELERLGHQVLGPTGDAGLALQLAQRWLPHLVLIDITLPTRFDGIALARSLKQELSIRSVFLSAHGGEAVEHREIALGLLTKLYLPESVVHCLGSLRARIEGRESPAIPHLMEIFP